MAGGEQGVVVALDWQQAIVKHVCKAAARIGDVGKRVEVIFQEDVTKGLAQRAPWDVIVVNGAIAQVPYNLIQQLDDEKGRILFFLHNGHESCTCWLVHKNGAILRERQLSQFRYTPIPGINGFGVIENLQEQYESARKAMETTTPCLTQMQDRVPYPLAKAFLSAFNAFGAHERHTRALKVSEAFTKYLSILTIASCTALESETDLDEKSRTIIAMELRKISERPSCGQWFAAMRTLLPIARKHPVGQRVEREFERAWNCKVPESYQKLQQETGSPNAGMQKTVKLRDFLEKIIEYRNKSGEGHGNVVSEKTARIVANDLLQAFCTIMVDNSLFSAYQLGAIVKHEKERSKTIVHFMKLQGANNISERWEFDHKEGSAWLPGVVLFSESEKSRRIVLHLHPWMVWEEGRNKTYELFLFNSRKEKHKFEYITYHNQDVYPDPELNDAFEDLFTRFPEPHIDPAVRVFQNLLPSILGDGKVTVDKMLVLRNAVIGAKLVSDEAAADKWIREFILREYPGVCFEE